MELFYKGIYKPRFVFYFALTALVLIADGILTLFAGLFGYSCVLYTNYCEWNLRKDIERHKAWRAKK